jgi:hypothetical protein
MSTSRSTSALPATLLIGGSAAVAAYMVLTFRSWAASASTFGGGSDGMTAVTVALVGLVAVVAAVLLLYLHDTRRSI